MLIFWHFKNIISGYHSLPNAALWKMALLTMKITIRKTLKANQIPTLSEYGVSCKKGFSELPSQILIHNQEASHQCLSLVVCNLS